MSFFRVLKSFVFTMLIGVSGSLWAHTELSSSVPAEGAQLAQSPEQLELAYGQSVRLMRLRLIDGGGEAVPLDFQPTAKAAKRFTHPLPKLPDGAYTLEWGAMAEDGHNMSGSVSFEIAEPRGEP